MQLYSFDVFDTLITRITATPQGIFVIMQQTLCRESDYAELSVFLRTNFARLRQEAEIAVRKLKKAGVQEITLQQIYERIGSFYVLTPQEQQMLMQLEIDIERACSVPKVEIIAKLLKLQSEGNRVIIISDIYLPESCVRELLVKAEPRLAQVKLYVSSTYGKTKSRGDLYKLVQKAENIPYQDWLHTGDNLRADISVPAGLGISTEQVEEQKRLPFEKFLERQLPDNAYAQILTGCARLARKNASDTNHLFNIGCSIGGPLLIPYVEWVLEQCKLRHIDRLYFIARDGYLLQKLADQLIKQRKLPIETCYIYGSRQVWHSENWHTQEQKDNLNKYLRQEIKQPDANFAFVDLFGAGASLRGVAQIIKEFSSQSVKVFYYRMGNEPVPEIEKYAFCSFVDIWNNIELFCRAPEGQCLGYKETNGRMEPVCDERQGRNIQQFGFADYEAGILDFGKVYARNAELARENLTEAIVLAEWYIRCINEFPNQELRKFLVEFPREHPANKIAQWQRDKELQIKKLKYLSKALEKSKYFNLLK